MADEHMQGNMALRRKSDEKEHRGQFDVFLSYNSKDRERVIVIGEQLKNLGISIWFDQWELRPGLPWKSGIERAVPNVKSAAIFIGASGVGRWQGDEIDIFLAEAKKRFLPVIPVLLSDAPDEAGFSRFLKMNTHVNFRVSDPDPMQRLIWGITGERRWEDQHHVLIATLGESPVVVSAMYDLLTQREGLAIEEVIVLYPRDLGDAFDLIKKALPNGCNVWAKKLLFEDANSWRNACAFLQELYTLLDTCQLRGDTIHLSLAGGRKSMAALMAWVAPFFWRIKHLYHVIDPDEDHLLTFKEIILGLSRSEREAAMHPDLDPLILVDIPFEPGKQIDQQFVSRLKAATDNDLDRMEYEVVEKARFIEDIEYGGKVLEVLVTQRVLDQFRMLSQQDRKAARQVRECLDRMCYTAELRNLSSDSFPYKDKHAKSAKSTSVDLHFFKSFGTPVQPVFYTRYKDIYTAWDSEVEQVVICELEVGENGEHRRLQEIVSAPGFSIQPAERLEDLPYIPPAETVDSVLIVPLGTSPMVATQLYTLLKRQEGREIRKVVLVYPEWATEIVNGADLIERALQEEAHIPCTHVTVEGYKDIDSRKACEDYQTELEKAIDDARATHPGCTIDLALSGGRKGMTAMTIFAAQNKGLPYVYHTLIADQQLSNDIDDETTVEKLKELNDKKRLDRLFLRKYEEDGSLTKFVLFKVPVFPAG
jgi:CRISPR-associated Csx14 family protein